MSGYSDTIRCSRCGNESLEASVDKDDVSGICLECGYEYRTISSLLSLEEVNDERKDMEMEPITELKKPVESWVD